MGTNVIVHVGDDWLEVRPGQMWAEWQLDGRWEHFKVLSVSSDRAKVLWPNRAAGWKNYGTKRLSAFRTCELIQDAEDVEKEVEN